MLAPCRTILEQVHNDAAFVMYWGPPSPQVELIVVSEVSQKLHDLYSIFDCPPADGQLGSLPGAYVASLLLEGPKSARGKLAGANELPVHQLKAELANSRSTKAVIDAVVETDLVSA
jgi:hypothetical protein